MAVFESSEKFQAVITGFFRQMAETPSIADKLLDSKLIIRFIYSEPDLSVLVDCSGEKIDIRANDTDTVATVEMTMKADVAHKFWYGKVNLTRALSRRQIVAKGPVPKVLKLLPAIKPSYALYPVYLQEHNFGEYDIH